MKRRIVFPLLVGSVFIVVAGAAFFIAPQRRQHAIERYFTAQQPTIPSGVTVVNQRALLPDTITTKSMLTSANVVLRGTVTALGAAVQDERGRITHTVTVVPTTLIKNTQGLSKSGPVIFTVTGGQVGNTYFVAEDAPVFTVGEEVLVFLQKGTNGFFVVDEGFGKLTVANNTVTGVLPRRGVFTESVDSYTKNLQ